MNNIIIFVYLLTKANLFSINETQTKLHKPNKTNLNKIRHGNNETRDLNTLELLSYD
jgi:hypothetical protein